ncbi:apolipoprotein D-like isoform X2 [Tachypleus tridentatus]|uniref:apolipoprotein D-like isoform X2 n=1 Tax=Tachypleus tridentatus TaxID=6853 RepID=UPI003FD625BD
MSIRLITNQQPLKAEAQYKIRKNLSHSHITRPVEDNASLLPLSYFEMNWLGIALSLVYTTSTSKLVNGYVFKLGSCPNVEVQENFSLDKFLGQWYVIQRFQTNSQCLKQNVTKENGIYYLSQNRHVFDIDVIRINRGSISKGKISIPDEDLPSKMIVDFPLNPFGKVNYWVMMTDYDNYAAIWSCQRMLLGHFENAEILSRSPSLDKVIVNKIRGRFETYGVDENQFSVIDQEDCPELEKKNGLGLSLLVDNIFDRFRT